jgi:iron-sulfur cluster repair protein YtfE (RIC family)
MDLDSALTDKPAEGASATDILRADHAELRRLFAEYRTPGEGEHARKVLSQAIAMQIELHDTIEREIIYPVSRKHDPEAIDRALREHDEMVRAIDELKSHVTSIVVSDAAVRRLQQLAEPHMRKEEESLFPLLEKKSARSLRELGAKLIARKEELTSSTSWYEGPAT